ncbi:replication initiator protein A (plasmid) [Deinococcus sp. KNUC1210]|uniref:replication initiator protein A n=1 Tax=Deinococcus sp. KNUC1210 TaxID=2917691 RepID=UPI001EF12520|nr:replication initiator protein A [Deinococcus sp. KNUC1210]ULH16958.1 replication initiator protein A [Deinococcus sp. KNUC1210]
MKTEPCEPVKDEGDQATGYPPGINTSGLRGPGIQLHAAKMMYRYLPDAALALCQQALHFIVNAFPVLCEGTSPRTRNCVAWVVPPRIKQPGAVKPVTSKAKPLSTLDNTSGLDELNLGRLSLNSAQKTVPADMRRWEKSILTPDGRPVVVVCAVEEGEVVPHGLDNDFMVGLINLCFEAGVPNGPFTTTGYALLKAAGLPDSAQYYQAMQHSLRRLSKAKYSVDEAWYRHQGSGGEWLSQEFSQISYLAVRRSTGGITPRGIIMVQLGVPILDSLRAGYIKPLDLEFYRSLSQPLVRALYRQLDALQFDELAEDGLSREVTAPLLGWAVRLGLFSDRPDNIVRALQPAHQELLDKKYLQEIEHQGKGRSRTVRYVFAGPPKSDHPELAEMLMSRGVKKGMALRLSASFPERIPPALQKFDTYLQQTRTPVGNPAGLLVAMVKSPEQYEGMEAPGANLPSAVTRTQRPAVSTEADAEQIEKVQAIQVANLTGPALSAWAVKQLNILGVMKHLSVAERALLGDALAQPNVDIPALVKRATQAAYSGQMGVLHLAEELRAGFVRHERSSAGDP